MQGVTVLLNQVISCLYSFLQNLFLLFLFSFCSFSFAESSDDSPDRLELLTTLLSHAESHSDSPSVLTLGDARVSYETEQPIRFSTIWSLYCYKKEFDNTKFCLLRGDDLRVYLINGKYSVVVGSDHYPKTRAGLRIDNNKVAYGYEGDFSNSSVLLNQLKKGKFAYTRYQEWPYLYQIDKKTDLKEFNAKFNEMLKRYKTL